MSKHFDRVNNRVRPGLTWNEKRPTVYRPEEFAPVTPVQTDGGGAGGYDNLLDYWHILVRHRMTLLFFAIAGLGAAVVVSMVQTPIYRARLSLEIQDFNENFLEMKDANPTNPTAGLSSADSFFQTQIKILSSDSLLERVADKMQSEPERHISKWASFASHVRRTLGLSEPNLIVSQDAFVGRARANLTVRATGDTRLVEVIYDSQDPKFAADFANTLVDEFTEQSQEMRWKSSERTAASLTSHLQDMKNNLEKSETELQDYARNSGLVITDEKENVADVKLKQ